MTQSHHERTAQALQDWDEGKFHQEWLAERENFKPTVIDFDDEKMEAYDTYDMIVTAEVEADVLDAEDTLIEWVDEYIRVCGDEVVGSERGTVRWVDAIDTEDDKFIEDIEEREGVHCSRGEW